MPKNDIRPINYRQVTERFCSKINDNVVVEKTVTDLCEKKYCSRSKDCPQSGECKHNI